MTIADAQLAEWEALAARATEGPWDWEPHGDDEALFAGPSHLPGIDPGPLGINGRIHRLNILNAGADWDINHRANKDFIASARSVVPALVAEVRRLRAIVNPDNGRQLICNVCGETALQVCVHLAGAREGTRSRRSVIGLCDIAIQGLGTIESPHATLVADWDDDDPRTRPSYSLIVEHKSSAGVGRALQKFEYESVELALSLKKPGVTTVEYSGWVRNVHVAAGGGGRFEFVIHAERI